MKKSKTGIIIAIAVIVALIWAGIVGFFVVRFVGKQTAAYTAALETEWSEYCGENSSELFTALGKDTAAKVKRISKNKNESGVTLGVEVSTKDFGKAVKAYKEKNKDFLSADELLKKQLELLEKAESVKKTYELKAKGDKSSPDIELTPEFINAMLGFVYGEEEIKAEGFTDKALAGFVKACDINGEVNIDYDKIDKIIKTATSISRFENKIYYATYKQNASYETSEYFTRKLRCYDMETGEDKTIYSYDGYWEEYGISATIIKCLSEGVLIAKQEEYYESGDYTYDAFIYDYKEGKSKKLKVKDAIPVYEADVKCDYKDGVLYYTAGQDGFGDIRKLTPDDEVESTAIDFDGDYEYIQDLRVLGENIYFDKMDKGELEASDYKNRIYSIYKNDGTSTGEAVVSDTDGGFWRDMNGNLLFFRGSKLYSYSPAENNETELADTGLTEHGFEIRFGAGDVLYLVGYKNEKDGDYYTEKPYMYKFNAKSGEIKQMKDIPERVMYGY